MNEWLLVGQNGQNVVTFTSMLAMSVTNESSVLSNPVEPNQFHDYNKVQSPAEIRVTLGLGGERSDHDVALQRLDALQISTELVVLVTPNTSYPNLTLESYNYRRTSDNGAYLLVVELVLKEVREVEITTTTVIVQSQAKNPSSVSDVDRGTAETVNISALEDLLKGPKRVVDDFFGRGSAGEQFL